MSLRTPAAPEAAAANAASAASARMGRSRFIAGLPPCLSLEVVSKEDRSSSQNLQLPRRILGVEVRSLPRPVAGVALSLAALAAPTGAIFGLRTVAPVLSLGVLYVLALLPV